MSDSNWLGILGGFWLVNQASEDTSSNSMTSMRPQSGCTDWGEYKGSSVEYVPEDEKTCARNFVHRYVTDGERIYTTDEYCIFVNRLGVVYQDGQDSQGLPSFNIYPCKKKNSIAILQQGTFWDGDDFSRFQRRHSDKLLSSLARKGFPINKKQFKIISKFDLLKDVYPNTFRVLTAEESYYYWKGQHSNEL